MWRGARNCWSGCGPIRATGRIEDVRAVCAAFGIACTPPRKGSHYKVKHESQAAMLTVPANKPIKPWYVEALVAFVDAVRETQT